MIPDELKRRFHRFLNKHGSDGSRRHSILSMEIAQKGLAVSGASLAKTDQLDMQLNREQFHGYDTEQKKHDGSTFEKGIIGICLEYFSTHPEELNLNTIRDICQERQEAFQRYLEVITGVLRQRAAQQGLPQDVSRSHIAMVRSGLESIWHGGIIDLAHELKLLLDRINFDKKQALPPQMNVITKGITIIGNGNSVNANFLDLSKELEALRKHIEAIDKFNSQEKAEVHAEIATIQNQLANATPNRSIIMKAWEGVGILVKGKGLYDLLNTTSPLIAAAISYITK